MLSLRIIIVAVCALIMNFSYQKAFASDNGVIKLEVPDAEAVGMGEAFTGDADRPSAVYYNPAGITQMVSAAVSAGITFLQPQIEYKSPTGSTIEMIRDDYIFPHIYVTTPVIKDKFYIGVGENSDFGAGNDWAANSPIGFTSNYMVKDSIENKDYMLVAAYKLNDQWSFGAGAIDDDSKVEDYKLINQLDGNLANALLKANDNAWGFNLAALFTLNNQNQFGLSYKSPIHHTYSGTLYLQNLDNGPLGLQSAFGGTSASTKAVQKFTLPQSVTLGYSLKPTSKWKINFDLEWTDWSNTKNEITSFPNATPGQLTLLGLDDPTQPRDWTSVWSESFGAEYAITDKFRIRGGYSHHQSPIPKATIDTQFFDSDSNSYTAGIGYNITKNITIDIAYVADFYVTRNVVNTVGNAFPISANLNGKYKEFVNLGTATLTYKY